MPLTEEMYNTLTDDEKGFYIVGDDGNYTFDTSKVDPGKELKEALRKERELRKNSETEAARLKREKEESDTKAKEEQEQYKDLYQTEKQKREQSQEKSKGIVKKTFAERVALSLTKDKGKRSLLENQISQYINVDDDWNLKIEGIAGVEDENSLVDHVKEQYPFLVDGTKAKGGDAGGNDSGGATDDLVKSSEEIDAMNAQERMDFFKKGGKRKKE